ncbi:MAG: retropepsin-like aspartic protease [Betaproteobacteria bacterium]
MSDSSSRSPGRTPERVLADALAASGGAAWLAVHRLEIVGRLRMGGLQGPFRQSIDLAGGRFAIEFSLGAHAFAGGFDGVHGWQRSPNGEVLVQDADAALRAAATDAWLNARGWWFAARWPAELQSLASVVDDGVAHDVIRCLPAGGQPVDLWFDAATHRLARVVQEVLGKPSVKRFDDYRAVRGLWLPFRTTSGGGDPRFDRVNEVDDVRVDAALPQATFQAPLQQVDDVRFIDGSRRARVPVDVLNHHVFVDVELDGHPLRFVLDTGGVNLVTTATAARLGLRGEGELEARAPGASSVVVGFLRVDRLVIGGAVALERQLLRVLPMPGFDEVEGAPFDGILGVELFKRLVVRIDYAGSALELSDPAAFEAPDDARSLPLTFFGHFPGVDGDLDGVPGQFWLDTGNRGGLVVAGPFAQAHGLAARYPASGVTTIGWGVGGGVEGRLARAGRLALGAVAIAGPVLRLPADDGGGAMALRHVAGNVGGEILSRFDVTFDYARQRVLLVPNAGHDAPFAVDRSGLWINRRGDSVIVMAVMAGGPAAAAGLRADDVIAAIDGAPASTLTLDALRRRLRDLPAGTALALQVMRSGESFVADLRLEDLVAAGG